MTIFRNNVGQVPATRLKKCALMNNNATRHCAYHLCMFLILSTFNFNSIFYANAFNLEYRRPVVKRGQSGSYFGYSVAEHIEYFDRSNGKQGITAWLLVGAPLGQNLQPGTNHSGALFKCPISNLTNDCIQVETDGRRNTDYDEDYEDTFTKDGDDTRSFNLLAPLKDEMKDGQWLGVTVKSQHPGGNVMVCAHRYIKSENLAKSHHGIGLCYLLKQNLTWEEDWEPCAGRPMSNEHLDYAYCQAGTSLAFLDEGTVLIGAPGPHTWRGTIFAKMGVGNFLNKDHTFYSSPLNDLTEPIDKYSYLGMSVTGGKFFSKTDYTYVSGAPRANLNGQVYFIEKKFDMNIRLILKGEQFASNYGYELLATDVNNDGYDDLLVAAPFYFNETTGGAVYVYYNIRHCRSNFTCDPDEILYGLPESRFGFAMASLGDINKDGYNDVAIGAPYEANERKDTGGAIYVYLGNADRLREPAQRITIPQHTTIGYSLSGGIDMDDNGYPDLLSGAYDMDTVILFLTRPIIYIEIKIEGPELKNIDTNKTGCSGNPISPSSCFSFKVCTFLSQRGEKRKQWQRIAVVKEIKADLQKSKGQFVRVKMNQSTDEPSIKIYQTLTFNRPECTTHTVYIKDGIRDILSPIDFSIEYSLHENEPHSPMLNKTSKELFQANFVKDCGSNDVCESDLKMSAGLVGHVVEGSNNSYTLDLGSLEELQVQVNISNLGEPAYEAQAFIKHSSALSYIALMDRHSNIKCIYHNDTMVICNLGNPYPSKKSVNLILRFENKNQWLNKMLEFTTFINTTSNTPTKNISAMFTVEVNMTANVKIDSYGTKSVYYGGVTKDAATIKFLEEVGPRVVHYYQITNDGKRAVSDFLVHIDWPLQVQGKHDHSLWLLYLESQPLLEFDSVVDDTACEVQKPHIANELNFERSGAEAARPENLMMVPLNFRRFEMQDDIVATRNRSRRDVDEEIVPARLTFASRDAKKNNHTFDCAKGTAKCVRITCKLPTIPKKHGAIITIASRLWNSTLSVDFLDTPTVEFVSRAFIESSNHSIEIAQPESFTVTIGLSTAAPQEPSVPYWVLILAVLLAIVLLMIIILCLWTCGFFKRKQIPPTGQIKVESPEESGPLLKK